MGNFYEKWAYLLLINTQRKKYFVKRRYHCELKISNLVAIKAGNPFRSVFRFKLCATYFEWRYYSNFAFLINFFLVRSRHQDNNNRHSHAGDHRTHHPHDNREIHSHDHHAHAHEPVHGRGEHARAHDPVHRHGKHDSVHPHGRHTHDDDHVHNHGNHGHDHDTSNRHRRDMPRDRSRQNHGGLLGSCSVGIFPSIRVNQRVTMTIVLVHLSRVHYCDHTLSGVRCLSSVRRL